MIQGSISGGNLDGLLGMLQRLAQPDLRPLAETIKRTIIDGNREGLLAGTDGDGNAFAPLAERTYEARRQGMGPPTVPEFSGSVLIERFNCDVTPDSGGGFTIKAGWNPNEVPQLRFFVGGTRNMPPRNPIGIRPNDRAKIRQNVADFAAGLLAGGGRFGGVGGFGGIDGRDSI